VPDPFETAASATDPAMIVVTTATDDVRAGCLVGFHAQSSISPQRYCVWLSKANHTYRTALRAERFVVHFLTSGDLALAEHFGTRTGDDGDKFAGVEVELGPGGVPMVAACPNRLVGERISMLDDGGDHVCLSLRVDSAQSSGPFEPLRLSDVEHLDPGHLSEERAVHP
jgi:flavin reductase (DIM6/NTAB) family NADH-FMN oxidoreductase RutF